MDYAFTQEQITLKASVTDFAKNELNRNLRAREERQEFPFDEWRACARFGIQGLPVPKELGGLGLDVTTSVAAMEGLGYGCKDNGLLFSLNAQLWSVEIPLLEFGTPKQRKMFVPGLVNGTRIGAHAMTEPGSGSDAFSMKTTAEQREGGFVLNGSKAYITNAPVADIIMIYAILKPGQGILGASAFLVEKGTDGLQIGKAETKMGLRTSPLGELTLRDCFVPSDRILGKPGSGLAIFDSSMEWERSCILASALGTMQRQLEACVAYAQSRKQFGQSIGKYESIANKISDMYLRLEASRSLVYKVAWLKQQGKRAIAEAAAAKTFTSEAWVQSSLDAIQIHGAFGYMSSSEVERDLRDAVAGTIYSGTSEIQRVIIARSLGL